MQSFRPIWDEINSVLKLEIYINWRVGVITSCCGLSRMVEEKPMPFEGENGG